MRFATPFRLGADCTPAPTWYEANGDGTYTRHLYAAAACGGTVISAAQYTAETGRQAAAVTPSGQPVSTQTAAPVSLVGTNSVAPGVWQCTMTDGSSHYCDVHGQPISYTPPAAMPAVVPAASLPTAAVSPTVTPIVQATVGTPVPAVNATGQVISSTTGTATAVAAAAGSLDLSSITTWLHGSLFGGIPNWLLAGGAAALLFFGGDSKPARRR